VEDGAQRLVSILQHIGFSKLWASLRNLTPAPLTAALLLYPSLTYPTPLADGPDTVCSGAPLIWNCDSISASLEHNIFLVPLLFDVLTLGAVSTMLMWAMSKILKRELNSLRMMAVIAIWTVGFLAAPTLALGFVSGAYFWLPPEWLGGPYGAPSIGFVF